MDKIDKLYSQNFSNMVWQYIKDNAIIYEEIHRQIKLWDGKALYYSLNKDHLTSAYTKMEIQNKKFILIIEDGESNWYHYKNQEKIHKLCEQTGVPEDKIVYLTNDVMCDVVYDKWFTNQTTYKTKINFISHPCILMQNLFELKKSARLPRGYYDVERYQDREVLPTKKFICLMGHRTKQRDFLWNFLKDKNGHTSYLGKNVMLLNSNINPEEIDQSSPVTDRLKEYYRDSYFSIVPEGEGGAQLSEKIGKGILNYHPFILLSYNSDIRKQSVGMLSRLKEWGFETFPELFDESYDEISDVNERRKNFRQQILRLYNMETKELHKLCESVEEKCIHNRKILLSLEIPNKQLIDKLESLKNG